MQEADLELTISSHGSERASLLQHLDDLVLVLGEDFGKPVGACNEVVLEGSGETAVEQFLRVVNLCTHTKHLATTVIGQSLYNITSRRTESKE